MLPNNQKFFRPYESYTKPQIPTPKFVPYESDSELEASDSEGSDVTRTTDSPENLPDTVKFATGLQLNEAGGQDFPNKESQLQFGVNKIQKHTNYASVQQAFNIDLPFDSKAFDTSGAKIWPEDTVAKQPMTSIIMLNSRDRDRSVYPTPANVTLRLPRVYANITSMQVVQMKLLSSFLYFRAEKNNISITINEFGRILYNYLNQSEGPLNITNFIREGTYNINTLIAELTIQLNTPPIFFDYPGGFNQFVPLFVSTGDFGYAFNYPGDYFYDSLNRTYTVAPTRSFIITRYWATTTLGFTPNLKQTKVAYYYPVLREYVLDPDYGIGKLNTTGVTESALLPNETIYSRIVYGFQGVNDIIIQQMIDLNVVTLDIYRSEHTFRQSLVNRYVVNYETFNNRLYIQSPSLNTSLVNLLNTQYQIFLAQQLTNFGLNSATYAALQSVNSALLSIINAMYDYIQTQLAIVFGINFNTFAPIYFTQPNNYINIQNALNAIGVSSNYDINVISNPNDPFNTNVIEFNRKQPTVYWPNMSNLTPTPGLGMQGYNTNLGASNQAPFLNGSNFPYSITTDDLVTTDPFIDEDGKIFIDVRRKAGDIIVPIQAARYTVFRFNSDYRQTLQVETMPRPTQYRYPAYNALSNSAQIQQVFDNSYSFVFNTSNAKMDNVPFSSLSNIYGYSNSNVSITTNFGATFAQSAGIFWGTNSLTFNVANNLLAFVFYLPLPPSPPAAPAYRHQMALTLQNFPSTLGMPSDMSLFLYHDRAAFMADLSGNERNENPLHYKESIQTVRGQISGDLYWTAYAGQTYYCILRSTNISFQSLQVQLVLWYPDGSNYTPLSSSLVDFNPFADPTTPTALSNFNYAQVNDPAFIKLPVQSNLWGYNPLGNEVNQGLAISNVAIGYDANGVSTDLTDYVGFVSGGTTNNLNPQALIRNDPISRYFFQVGSPYSQTAQSYFYTDPPTNFILAPANQANYDPTDVAYRQFKVVHWYNSIYIPDPAGFPTPLNPLADVSPFITPYRSSNTIIPISNYTYDPTNSNIQLGTGCSGFSFVPSDGIWSVDKVMFRSAIISPNDPNDSIKFLGIFLTNYANSFPISRLALSNAVAKLNFTKKVVYTAGTVNFGFDAALGTYYEFDKDTAFTQGVISGFSQNAAVLTTDPADFYSVIPFDAQSNVIYMRGLTGSLTTYPYVTDASAAQFYFDGNEAPNRKGIVMPLAPPPTGSPFGPPAGISYTLSAYEQSIPIGTQILHYLSVPDILQDLSGFVPWSGPGYAPSQIYADVSGVMMMQTTDFKFYSYPYDTITRTFSYLYTLTVDDIYPGAEATTLVAAAGNSTAYAFLGFQVVGGAYQVRIKLFTVGTGLLTDISVPATFQIPDLGFSVNTFSFTDTYGFVISGTSGTGVARTYRTPSLSAVSWIIDTFTGYTNVKSVQPPTSGFVYSLPYLSSGISSNIYFRSDELTSTKDTITILSGSQIPTNYVNICVSKAIGSTDQVFFLTTQNLSPALTNAPSRYFQVKQLVNTGVNAFNAQLDFSDLVFQAPPPSSAFIQPLNIVGGALGSKWVFFSTPPYIWGNRNDDEDAPVKVQNAWQIFYPTTKIVLRKLANAVNPIIDLSGLQYPEYPHTQMFVYNTKKAFVNDISYNTFTYNQSSNTCNTSEPRFSQWGYELSGGLLPTNKFNLNSNGFYVSDVDFNGFYFNSYIFNVPLLPNSNSPEPFYYLAVRNYTPSEKSQVLMRFNLPQRYDFGFVRIRDLSNEWVDLSNNPGVFNPSYYSALSNFEFSFRFSNVNFGYNPTQNIAGSNITSTGFGYFINLYTRLFNLYNSNVQVINTITSNVNSNMLQFIQDYLLYVLPDYAQTRQNFTEALQFSILWRSSLTPLYLKLEDDWGLGYNLGFEKLDTPYATIQRAPSFFKILDDYIYLRLNVEYDMNKMDFGGKENLKETTDSTGQINGYNGKLLLNTFGSYAQTIIQNPVYFNPPVLRLEKLTFQWFDTAGTLITNTECDWNAAIQLVEEVPKVNLRGKNPVIIPR